MADKKILVADSDPIFLEFLGTELKNSGLENYSIIIASDGQEALKKIRKENPSLIIAEENLYSISGYKLSRLVKFDKKRSNIPFILLTSNPDEQNEALARETGVNDYLQHAVDKKLLSRILFYITGKG